MAGSQAKDRFHELSTFPTPERLAGLNAGEFERFVAEVFRTAGYEVSRPRLNFSSDAALELLALGNGRKRSGVVVLKHIGPNDTVSSRVIRRLHGSRPVKHEGASAYIVTTGRYEQAAIEYATTNPNIYLLGAAQLCRYIRYVQHSRYAEASGITVVIPPDRFAGAAPQSNGMIASRATVLAIANNKGGVGKTTTAWQIAHGLAAKNKRVLLVDLDPQGNLTEVFLDTSSKLVRPPHLAQYFAGTHMLAQLVRPTSTQEIALIPAHPDLSLLDTGGAGRPDVEMRFAVDLGVMASTAALGGGGQYDWIILDTPPAVSMFTRAALAAADYVIAPARSRPSSLSGIENMMRTMITMGELTGKPPHLIGGLITHWSEDQNSTDTYVRLEELFNSCHSRIMAQEIPFDVTVEKRHGQTHHRASNAYEQVVEEVLNYVERR